MSSETPAPTGRSDIGQTEPPMGGKSDHTAPAGGKPDPGVTAPEGVQAEITRLVHWAREAKEAAELILRERDPEYVPDSWKGTPEGWKAQGVLGARQKLGGIPERAAELAKSIEPHVTSGGIESLSELQFCIQRITDVLDGKP